MSVFLRLFSALLLFPFRPNTAGLSPRREMTMTKPRTPVQSPPESMRHSRPVKPFSYHIPATHLMYRSDLNPQSVLCTWSSFTGRCPDYSQGCSSGCSSPCSQMLLCLLLLQRQPTSRLLSCGVVWWSEDNSGFQPRYSRTTRDTCKAVDGGSLAFWPTWSGPSSLAPERWTLAKPDQSPAPTSWPRGSRARRVAFVDRFLWLCIIWPELPVLQKLVAGVLAAAELRK